MMVFLDMVSTLFFDVKWWIKIFDNFFHTKKKSSLIGSKLLFLQYALQNNPPEKIVSFCQK